MIISKDAMRIVLMLLAVPTFIGWARNGAEGRLRSGDDKMVGGEKVQTTNSIPHVASLLVYGYDTQNKWSPVCGGTILSKLFVLTACLCVYEEDASGTLQSLEKRFPLDKWEFKAGTVHLFDDDTSVQKRRPVRVERHPNCHTRAMQNNVAVAKMKDPFAVNDYVKPVEIYTWDRENFGATLEGLVNSFFSSYPPCYVAGFGSNTRKSIKEVYVQTPATTVRQTLSGDQVQIKKLGLYPFYEGLCVILLAQAVEKSGTYSSRFWEDLVNKYQEIYHDQFCALSQYKNESVCEGSAGSGLICRDFLVGTVSSYGACGAEDPILFVDLQTVIHWIQREVCDVKTCDDALHIRQDCLPQDEIQDHIRKRCHPARNVQISPKSLATRRISSLWVLIFLAVTIQ